MSENNNSTGQALGGAFGGDMKYVFIWLIASAGAMMAGMFGTVHFVPGVQGATYGLIVGLFLGGGVFVLGWLATYYVWWTKISTKHHFMLIIRPENYIWNVFFDPDKTKIQTIEYLDSSGTPTGWRSKRFILMEPTEFEPLYQSFGKVNEFVIHYYGNFNDSTEPQSGNVSYRDMEMPHGNTDILDVKPVEWASVNIKHGSKIPIFELIGGRYIGKHFDPTKIIPNPYTHKVTTTNLAVTDNSQTTIELQKTIQTYERALAEKSRQSQEDKSNVIMNQQVNELQYGEYEGVKDISGKMHDISVSTIQHVVTAMNSWYDGLAHMMGNKWSSWIPIICVLLGFFGVLVFLGLNPQLFEQAKEVTQNPTVDLAIIAVAIATVAVIYYLLKRRRKGRHR